MTTCRSAQLLSREEKAKAEDMDRYYRVPMDSRDLNYTKYVSEGEPGELAFEDYTSHNTERLDVARSMAVLKELDYVKAMLAGGPKPSE